MRRIFRFIKALWRYILYGKRTTFEIYCLRLNCCSYCRHFKEENWTCGICGCFVVKKAKMDTEACPERKW